MVTLNRAVAIGFADGPTAGLGVLDAIDAERLRWPHPRSAARAELLLAAGRKAEAAQEFGQALEMVVGEAERRHLERRLRSIVR